jgi:hypothetical protein
MTTKTISRRHVLRAAGVALTLPWLEAMTSPALGAPSKFKPWAKSVLPAARIIFCYVPNGVNVSQWSPKEAGKDYSLSPTLEVLKEHKDRFSVLTGLGHKKCSGGHSGADTWLTGADLKAVPGADYTNTISIDQAIADKIGHQTRIPSLQLSDQSGTGSAGHSHTLSFDASGTPLPAESSPKQLFDRLFVPDTASDREATLLRYAQKKSILDSILTEARSLQGKLGKIDRRKMDEYLSSVRETEARVDRLVKWIDVPKPNVTDGGLQLISLANNSHDRPMWIDVMLELSYLSFVTDTTRVISFEWAREASGYGGGGENHHELSHHGGDEEMLKKLASIDRFLLGRLERFIGFLKSTADGDANMLDRTVIVYGSGMNSGETGDHSPKDLPLLVAGGEKLGLRHGKHLQFDKSNHPPLANMFMNLAQSLGVELEKFQDSSGTLLGFE